MKAKSGEAARQTSSNPLSNPNSSDKEKRLPDDTLTAVAIRARWTHNTDTLRVCVTLSEGCSCII